MVVRCPVCQDIVDYSKDEYIAISKHLPYKEYRSNSGFEVIEFHANCFTDVAGNNYVPKENKEITRLNRADALRIFDGIDWKEIGWK